jgi:hypothetical protein
MGVEQPEVGGRIKAWVTHQYAAEAFRRVIEVLDRRGIEVLPVKGIILAHTLYDSTEDRPIVDVDLRVRPRDLGRVAQAACDEGWSVRRTSRQLGTLEFVVSRTLIEVETTIGPPGVCAIGVGEMVTRSVMQTGALGIPHREPELHDHALLLCVNAFKDKLVNAHPWAREDLLRIARVPAFSPATLAARAADARLRTLVSIVACWVADDSGDPGWGAVLAALGVPPRRRYGALFRALVDKDPDGASLALVARAASDTPAGQMKALVLGILGTVLAASRFEGGRARQRGRNKAPE